MIGGLAALNHPETLPPDLATRDHQQKFFRRARDADVLLNAASVRDTWRRRTAQSMFWIF